MNPNNGIEEEQEEIVAELYSQALLGFLNLSSLLDSRINTGGESFSFVTTSRIVSDLP